MMRKTPRTMGLFFAGVFVLASPLSVFPEAHHSSYQRNCTVDQTISLPLKPKGKVQMPPARGASYLRFGEALTFVGGLQLIRYDLISGSNTAIGRFSAMQVHLGKGFGGVYLLAGPGSGGASTASVTLSAYSTETLREAWQRTLGDRPGQLSAPIETSAGLLAGVGSGLTMLDPSTGRTLWTKTLSYLPGIYLSVVGDAVLMPNPTGMDAISAADGTLLWHRDVDTSAMLPVWTAAIKGDTAYLPLGPRIVGALDTATGRILWASPPTGSSIDSRHPVIAGKTLMVVSLQEGLAVLAVGDGHPVWSRSYPFLKLRQFPPSLVLLWNAILVGGRDGLYAVSPQSGEVIWNAEGLGEIVNIEVIGEKVVAVNSTGLIHHFEQ